MFFILKQRDDFLTELACACNEVCECGGDGPKDGCAACKIYNRICQNVIKEESQIIKIIHENAELSKQLVEARAAIGEGWFDDAHETLAEAIQWKTSFLEKLAGNEVKQ